jgi:hypothetical protein
MSGSIGLVVKKAFENEKPLYNHRVTPYEILCYKVDPALKGSASTSERTPVIFQGHHHKSLKPKKYPIMS